MGRQESLDRVWHHFVVMKSGPSLSDAGGCAYRGSEGGRCAIGVLITDEQYSEGMEGKTAEELVEGYQLFERRDITFLQLLQSCHDSSAEEHDGDFDDEIRTELTRFAKSFRLKLPEAPDASA